MVKGAFMIELITMLVLGIIIIILGAINMTGNVSSLHFYHRHRVREEDKKPFGRLVGLGTILCGVGVSAFGILTFALEGSLATTVGGIVLGAFLVIGLGISFYAMIKYNKGIF